MTEPQPQPLLDGLSDLHRARLLGLADDREFPADRRLFDEAGAADRFWLLRSGEVALDLHVPGRRPPVVETVGAGQLLGWSWLFPPYRWHLGARTLGPVSAWEFPAHRVRALCGAEPEFGLRLTLHCAAVIAERLQAARLRLVDLYAPDGGGPP
ncbi:cyclic nucleotide-binding domain-containing protein [Streptomyces sp. NRRL B-24484]|uniref:cyclic nucleotide-binding domain-containing protein n=1 Tax=Streptomyces sp. NRRL B-24484 TaxID=1463833 RepID=UPI0007C541F9|nr:cyclic nucleotide-binding domain-containing protein [Streptomyces sp. NRRL B-24484]